MNALLTCFGVGTAGFWLLEFRDHRRLAIPPGLALWGQLLAAAGLLVAGVIRPTGPAWDDDAFPLLVVLLGAYTVTGLFARMGLAQQAVARRGSSV